MAATITALRGATTPSGVAQEIADARQLIKGYENRIRVVSTNVANDRFYEEGVATRQARIVQLQLELEQFIAARDEGPAIIAHAKSEMAKLRKRVKLLENKRTIDRLMELQAQISEAREELGDEEVDRMLASGGDACE